MSLVVLCQSSFRQLDSGCEHHCKERQGHDSPHRCKCGWVWFNEGAL